VADDLRALLDAEGIGWVPLPPLVAAALSLAGWDGGNQYQARASLPGGRIIVCGVHGFSRDRAREDVAALFSTEVKHWTVAKLTRPPRRHTETITPAGEVL
jgi:hypothetical protein